MKIENTVGGAPIRPKSSEIFDRIKELSAQNSGHFEVHSEADFLRKYSWRGMLTIRFESGAYSHENDSGEFRRKNLIRLLMNDLRRKWGLRKNQIYWVASTEYGKSGDAHCHIIFNFYPLERKGKIPPDLSNLKIEAEDSLAHLASQVLGITNNSLDLNWKPGFNDFGLVGYVCKKEPGRDYKHFIWSTGGNRWLNEMTNYIVVNTAKEVAQ